MLNDYKCQTKCVHEETVERVRYAIKNIDLFDKMSRFFKAISDPTRMKILVALKESELCVCDISVILNMTQSAISHQLKQLKDVDLIRNRRDGKTIFYRLADDHVHQIFDQTMTHLKEKYDE